MITIEPSGDLIVKVVEYDNTVWGSSDEDRVILHEEDFLVSKQSIYKHSRVLGMLVARHLSSDQASDTFAIKDDSTTSMEIWFRTMNATLQEANYRVTIEETWNLAVAQPFLPIVSMLINALGRDHEVRTGRQVIVQLVRTILLTHRKHRPTLRFPHARVSMLAIQPCQWLPSSY